MVCTRHRIPCRWHPPKLGSVMSVSGSGGPGGGPAEHTPAALYATWQPVQCFVVSPHQPISEQQKGALQEPMPGPQFPGGGVQRLYGEKLRWAPFQTRSPCAMDRYRVRPVVHTARALLTRQWSTVSARHQAGTAARVPRPTLHGMLRQWSTA